MHGELTHLLQRAEWRSNFDERTLERARGYARDSSVTKLRGHVEDGTHVLTAQVDGSRGERYVCRVTVSDHDKWLIVDTRCSCPVGVACKHAAAMLMAVAGEGAGDGEACRTEPVGHAAHQRRLALSFRRERRPSPQTERPSCLPIGVEARLRIPRPPSDQVRGRL